VDGSGLLARKAEPAHHARHRLRAHALVEALLNEATQIRQCPGAGLPLRGIRPAQDKVDEHGLLGLAQPLAAVAFGPIDEPGDPLCVEALDGVAQGLALNPSRSRGLSPAHPVQGVGNGQKSQGGTSPALLFRHAAQIRRCPQVRSDRHRSSHRSLLATTGDHKPITQGIPPESHQERAGIRGW
jgi:hypothetical protein